MPGRAVGWAGADVLGTRHVLLPAVGSGMGLSPMEKPAWQTAAEKCWISRDISSRWPYDIEDSAQVAVGWDDTSLSAGPGWLCQSSAPGGRLGTKHSFACRAGKRPPASPGAGSATLQPGSEFSKASHSIVPQPSELGNPGFFSCW